MNDFFENRTNSKELGLLLYHLWQYPNYTASKNILSVSNYDTSAIIQAMQHDGKFVDCIPDRKRIINFCDGTSRKLKNIPISFKTYDLLITNCMAFNSKWEVFVPSLKLNDIMETLFKKGVLVASTKIIALAFDNQKNDRHKYSHRSLLHRIDGIITPRRGLKELSSLPSTAGNEIPKISPSINKEN